MAQLATGVSVVCVRDPDDDVDAAMTATSFTSVALNPPLVSLGVGASSHTHEVLTRSDRWSVTVLSSDQRVLAGRFGVAGRPTPRALLPADSYYRGPNSDALIIKNGLTALECRTRQRVTAGDHTIFIADVLAIAYVTPEKSPLLRFRRGYRGL